MKTRGFLVAMILLGYSAAFSQSEYDDVYFSKKDRQKQKALEPKTLKTLDRTTTNQSPVFAKANRKIEGYAGRTINPDYTSSQSTGTNVSSYFIPNYQPAPGNNSANSVYAGNSFGNSCYSCGGWGMRPRIGFGYSPFGSSYGYSPYGYGYGGMYDPYGYGSYGYSPYSYGYSPYGYGGMYGGSPYYGSGLSMGFGFGYGFGMYGSMYSNQYYYQRVAYANSPDNQVPRVNGVRSSRNGNLTPNGSMSRGSQSVANGQPTAGRGGRVATTPGTTPTNNRYYQRGWRQDPNVNPSSTTTTNAGRTGTTRSSGWVGGGTAGQNRSSSWGNSNSGWSGGSRGTSFGTSGASRSSGSSFNSGGSFRSGGGGFGGGGGNTHSSGGHSGGGHSGGGRGRP